MAVAEHAVALAAVGALEIAHILNNAENGDLHHLSHFDRLFNDHADQLLGRGDNYNAVERNALENSQRNVAGSRRHIYKHVVYVVPKYVRPELLYRSRYHWRAPYNGVGVVF